MSHHEQTQTLIFSGQRLSANILTAFLERNVSYDLKMQCALSELKSGVKPADLTPFKEAIAEAFATREGQLTSMGHLSERETWRMETRVHSTLPMATRT